MKVFEIQHSNKTRDLITIDNIEDVSQVTEVTPVEYQGECYDKIVEMINITMKSSKCHIIKDSDKIFSLSDSHRTGKWEIVRHEISFDEFYTEIAVALIQKN